MSGVDDLGSESTLVSFCFGAKTRSGRICGTFIRHDKLFGRSGMIGGRGVGQEAGGGARGSAGEATRADGDRIVVQCAVQPVQVPEASSEVRLSGRGIRSLRRKLSLSQVDFGRLIGVTAKAIVNMEKKQGALAVRKVTKAAILGIRGLGAREAKAKLAEMGALKKTVKREKKA